MTFNKELYFLHYILAVILDTNQYGISRFVLTLYLLKLQKSTELIALKYLYLEYQPVVQYPHRYTLRTRLSSWVSESSLEVS